MLNCHMLPHDPVRIEDDLALENSISPLQLAPNGKGSPQQNR